MSKEVEDRYVIEDLRDALKVSQYSSEHEKTT
jgi:hypothetical protein